MEYSQQKESIYNCDYCDVPKSMQIKSADLEDEGNDQEEAQRNDQEDGNDQV
jgi:hypothetical protein